MRGGETREEVLQRSHQEAKIHLKTVRGTGCRLLGGLTALVPIEHLFIALPNRHLKKNSDSWDLCLFDWVIALSK